MDRTQPPSLLPLSASHSYYQSEDLDSASHFPLIVAKQLDTTTLPYDDQNLARTQPLSSRLSSRAMNMTPSSTWIGYHQQYFTRAGNDDPSTRPVPSQYPRGHGRNELLRSFTCNRQSPPPNFSQVLPGSSSYASDQAVAEVMELSIFPQPARSYLAATGRQPGGISVGHRTPDSMYTDLVGNWTSQQANSTSSSNNPSPRPNHSRMLLDELSSDDVIRQTTRRQRRTTRHLTTKEDANFQCEVNGCGKLFSRSYNYKAHMETHDDKREYHFPCRTLGCDKRFVRKTDLQRHHQSVHAKEKNHKCDYCGRYFARRDTLRRHMDDGCAKRFDISTLELRVDGPMGGDDIRLSLPLPGSS